MNKLILLFIIIATNLFEVNFVNADTHIANEPYNVRGIYVSSWSASSPKILNSLIKTVNETELNSMVIDVKDENGFITFRSSTQNPDIKHAMQNRIKNIDQVLSAIQKENIYTIGRLTVFQDSIYIKNHPESAIKNNFGGIWHDSKGLSWVDPRNEEFVTYIIEVAKLAHNIGFDEIQFDYIRFPSDGIIDAKNLPNSYEKDIIIENVIKKISDELSKENIKISFDIFGQTINTVGGMGIGQNFNSLINFASKLSPMMYPSHYVSGFKNITSPNQEPGKVINASIQDGVKKIMEKDGDLRILRPWIQDFSLGGITYNHEMVRAQIHALYEHNIFSWILWSPRNTYTKDALLGKKYLFINPN